MGRDEREQEIIHKEKLAQKGIAKYNVFARSPVYL